MNPAADTLAERRSSPRGQKDSRISGNRKCLVVLAAGLGSRYGGLKQMEGMGPSGEVILEYSVFDALRAGFTDVVFVVRRSFADEFQDRIVSRFSQHIAASLAFQDLEDLPKGVMTRERSKPWGTGHALWCARDRVRHPFAVVNADDFYGCAAFRAMGAALSQTVVAGQSTMAAPGPIPVLLAAYAVRDTLSLSGSGGVSRGLCTVDRAGGLQGIEELHGIARDAPTGKILASESGRHLREDDLVSMNFFGFTPEIFPVLEARFRAFLAAESDLATREFYLPSAVTEGIANGMVRAQAFPVRSRWLGVTYPEDAPLVRSALVHLHEQGDYPSQLWK